MIIRLFLGLFFAALIFLMIADLFYQLHLQFIADLIVQLGDEVLLFSFALLLITGLIFFSKQIGKVIINYFSAKERAKRQLFFSISQNDYLQRLFASKKQQLLYFANLKRERLLTKNNKRQVALLTKSILKELKAVQSTLSETQFKHYQQAIKQAKSKQDIQRLLELQREISTSSLIN